ncbi:MAG: DUF3568 family protein [Planctomycetota bacterium]
MTIRRGRRIAGSCLIAGLALGPAGCGVELAVLGAAASAASTGSAVVKQGKLDASWMGSFDLVVAAGEAAVGDLGLVIIRSDGDAAAGHWTITALDQDKEKIIVTVDRKSVALTEFRIDVGWFGSESTARLVLKRMAVAIGLAADRDGSGDVIVPVAPPAEEPSP